MTPNLIDHALTKTRRIKLVAIALLVAFCAGCSGKGEEERSRKLKIFHASGLVPVLDNLRNDSLDELRIDLLTEASGSQVACRKLVELERQCDLIMLADKSLVTTLLSGVCSWRIDFATDQVVLGVGIRAPDVAAAEKDWVSVLSRKDVRLGRVDENQGPIGYRTLLVWKLKERHGFSGIYEHLLKKCDKVMDHVTRLTPLLKSGEIDYAFIYRSICVARDIRWIELGENINLGSNKVDYSGAEVTYEKLKAGKKEEVVVKGAPIIWTLSVPERGVDEVLATRFVRYFLTKKASVLKKNGFFPIEKPLFYGDASKFVSFQDFTQYAGELK